MKISKGALKDLISEEVKKIEKINILEGEKNKIEKELEMLDEGILGNKKKKRTKIIRRKN